MKSIKEIYKIGRGPSSSHTMGPVKAAEIFRREHPEADSFEVTLYGSLAKTGRGHGTDSAIIKCLSPLPCRVVWDLETAELPHENTLDIKGFRAGEQVGFMRAMSIGGGDISVQGRRELAPPEVYAENTLGEIIELCGREDLRLSDYVFRREPELRDYLREVWGVMTAAVEEGIRRSGTLPGGLGVKRRAITLFNGRPEQEDEYDRMNRMVCAYAFGVSEQNAANGLIVTAPTCGACGVLPAVLVWARDQGRREEEIINALAVGGLIGNIVKHNASISGAECGCQAEIGTACSMAAAALAELYGMLLPQIEYSAEVAMEHHLGLTCDPVRGLVQIPCIERNAVAAMRAINAVSLARFLTDSRKISFDLVVKTMYETGRAIHSSLRETAEGGLAKLYDQN